MSVTLTIRDENLAGTLNHEQTLEFPVEQTTARELIRSWIYQEVQDDNRDQVQPFRGMVQPEATERALNNAARSGQRRPIDWKTQFDRAVEAFEANQILLLVDDRQVETLDEELTLRRGSVATFLRLTLLVGG